MQCGQDEINHVICDRPKTVKNSFHSFASAIWLLFHALFSCTAFLSRLPIYQSGDKVVDIDFRKTAFAFPLAGMLIALPALILLLLCYALSLPPSLTAILVTATQIIVTGALHEDGLADTADGFWGGQTREQKLNIMRDSAIGTYGTLALILSLALRIALLAAILPKSTPLQAVALVLAVSALSRAAMLWSWVLLPAARPAKTTTAPDGKKDQAGLSARLGMPDRTTLIVSLPASIPAIVLLFAATNPAAALAALGLTGLFVAAAMGMARHHIGGHTGDVLGATQQISEIGLLLGLVTLI